jgi:hypothetical protein
MAILRSLHVFLHDLTQIYIKETHVRTVLAFLEYTLSTVLILLGSSLGYALGQWLGVDNWLVYLLTGSGGAFFFWVAGTTTTLIMDDVNLAYVAVLYIISIDEINLKEKYAIDYLEEIEGKPVIILDQKRHEEVKADMKEVKENAKLEKQKAKEEKKKKREGVSQEKEIDNEPIIEQQQTEEIKTVVDTSQKPPE